ncbi:MAG: Hpt domain-containing protein [Planctomycetes bacterium]|nr:Hpt domain-containing protein [Planctomycetota bacterium]
MRHPGSSNSPAFKLLRLERGGLTWWVRENFLKDSLLRVLADPLRYLNDSSERIKSGRSTTLARAGGVIIKRYNSRGWIRLLKNSLQASRARRAFYRGMLLEKAGIRTARPIGFASRRMLGLLRCSYLLMEEIAGAENLSTWKGGRRQAVERIACLIGRLHEHGFSHRDLKQTNILFDPAGNPHLIDMEGLRFRKRLTIPRAARDLSRLFRAASQIPQLTRADKLRFLKCYCRCRGLVNWRDWLGKLRNRQKNFRFANLFPKIRSRNRSTRCWGKGSMSANNQMAAESLDLKVFLSLRSLQEEGEPDILEEVIQTFLEDTPQRLAALREALADHDWTLLGKAAHTLKGSSRNLGAKRLGDLCLKLEEKAAGGEAVLIGQLIDEGEEEFKKVARAMQAFRVPERQI